MLRGPVKRCGLVVLSLGLSSCFFYDSRWGQQKQAQKHEVARSTPRQLRSQSSRNEARVAERKLRLRVYATPGYAATVLDWQKQFAGLLECANSVFVPDFGSAFEPVELKTFRPRSNEEKLDGVLRELTEEDHGRDVDWVVGLATAVPRFAVSADDLGLAPLLGNHLVMRAMSDPHEYEAIQNGFTELSESERLKLYQVRKRHKLCTVFLHEIAHTLGVPHELLASSLMNRRYQVEAQGFSDEATDIVRASLELRSAQPNVLLDSTLTRNLSSWLKSPNAGWEPSSRDALLQELASTAENAQPALSAAAQSPAAPSVARPTPGLASNGPPVAGLNADEQRSYDRARAELNAGHAAAARELAVPLLAKHAALSEVQSLRCDIAMAVGGDWDTISAECPGLSPFGSGK
jgi:matrixin